MLTTMGIKGFCLCFILFIKINLVRDCGELYTIPNGNLTAAVDGSISFGATANVACDPGYQVSGYCNRSTEFQCGDGTCINEAMRCNAFPDCPNKLDELLCHVNVKFCPEGLKLCDVTCVNIQETCEVSEKNMAETDAGTISCLVIGKWEKVKCSPKDCGTPTDIENGNITLSEDGQTTYMSTADVTCDTGFSPSIALISCQADGSWENGTCNIIDCGMLTIPNGQFNAPSGTTYGLTATQSCDTSFTFSGEETVICTETGWNASAATCTIVVRKQKFAFTSWEEPPIQAANGSGKASIFVPENHPVGTSTGIKLKVLGGTGNVTYSMSKNPYFSVDPNNGDVILKSKLDYEAKKSINVTIGAMDESDPNPKTSTVNMTVFIADVNDNAPFFSPSLYSVSIYDSTSEGTPVVALSATDVEHNVIRYAVVVGNTDDFSVDSVSGLISVARPLMAYRQSRYYMSAIAFDEHGPDRVSLTSTTTVIITVLEDINETRCEPKEINMNVSSYLPVGKMVLIDILCSNWMRYDPYFALEESDLLFSRFSVTSYENTPYLIVKETSLHLNSTLKGTLNIRNGSANGTTMNLVPLTINFVSINDAPVISPVRLTINIPENIAIGTKLGTFTISDPDEGEWGEMNVHSYDIPDFLDIRPLAKDEFVIVVTDTLDVDVFKNENDKRPDEYDYYEYPQKYAEYRLVNQEFANIFEYEQFGNNYIIIFNIVALDSPGLNATAAVYLNITDVNDNAPICSPANILKKIPKDTRQGAPIVNLQNSCYDADLSSKNNILNFTIVTDSCSGFISVGKEGYVMVANQMNLTEPSCQLVIRAEDSGTPKLHTQVRIEIQFLECPNDTDYLGIPWAKGIPGMYMWGRCPKGTRSGWVKRFCDENGIYHDPVYNCTHPDIADIYNKLFYDPAKSNTIRSILDDLVNATNTSTNTKEVLLIGDIEAVNEMLSKIKDVVQANSSDIQHVTNSFIEVANNIMEENMTKTWKVIMNQTGSGADVVIDNLDRFVEQIITAPDSNITNAVFAKTNLMLKINTNVSCDRGIHFPNRTHDVVPTWAIDTMDSVKVPCGQSYQQRSYSSALYRNVSGIVPARVKGNKSQSAINAPVMSFTYYPNIVRNLEDPIEITFQVYNTTLESPRCSFWTRSSNGHGFWSDEGCWLHSYDKAGNKVICKCNHLTNFAVLMSPAVTATSKESSHHLTLSIISMTGCIISMICLFLTVVIHAILWRTVKSVRSIIHMNLASALFVAYLLFLTGVNRTENKGVCTAIAVLLHLLYLIVFFIMLTEGLILAYTVLKPLSTRKPGLPLLVAFYVLSVVIVGISMAAVQLEGYGNDSFCWLSTHMGLIWAFITPVLFVIVVNSVIVCLVMRKMCATVAMSRKTPKEKAKAGLRSVLVLMPIMGITWVFGIFSVNEDAVIFQYLFAIFNSLQGLLIFIFQCVMNRKVKEGLKRMFGRSKFKSTSGSSSADTQSPNKRTKVTKDTDV